MFLLSAFGLISRSIQGSYQAPIADPQGFKLNWNKSMEDRSIRVREAPEFADPMRT